MSAKIEALVEEFERAVTTYERATGTEETCCADVMARAAKSALLAAYIPGEVAPRGVNMENVEEQLTYWRNVANAGRGSEMTASLHAACDLLERFYTHAEPVAHYGWGIVDKDGKAAAELLYRKREHAQADIYEVGGAKDLTVVELFYTPPAVEGEG